MNFSVRAFLAELDAKGYTLEVTSDGEHLRLGYPKGSDASQVQEIVTQHRSTLLSALLRRRELQHLSQQAGHCGTCFLFSAAPQWGEWMGTCAAGRGAHGFGDGNPSLAVVIHMAHRCAADGGHAYQPNVAKGTRMTRSSGRKEGPPS